MVSDALRQVMLRAPGMGSLDGDGVATASAEHPVCGDELEFDCRIRDGRVLELAWRASACPATMAVAAAAAEAVVDLPVTDCADAVARRVQDLGGLARTERHALELARRIFAQLADAASAR